LQGCIQHLKNAITKAEYIEEYEIIYVDSNSSDESVSIAKENGVEVIEIVDGYTTASLGRYLGKKYSQYDNLLFIDSDMYLDIEWFNASKEYYEKCGAIIGERYEKLYKGDKVIKEIPRFYGIEKVEIASNIGGFLMIKKETIEDINYTPIIKNEEEKDFYAKFYHKAKIYRVPVLAYVHNNYNLTVSRVKDYLNPYAKNGYILSLIKSVKDGYFKNYIGLQKKYLNSILVSILFYVGLVVGNIFFVVSLVFLLLNGKAKIKGSLMTTVFFPYKFFMTLAFLMKKQNSRYRYQNKEYKIEIKL
jgi:hypothetical protein